MKYGIVFMITLYIENTNSELISQKFYNDVVASVNLRDITCQCGQPGGMIRHRSYKRTVKASAGNFRLCILRVKCVSCGRTHAIILSSMVPYFQIPLEDMVSVIACYEEKAGYDKVLSANLCIDENNISSLVLRYRRYWRQRFCLCKIPLFPVSILVKQCFSVYGRQFMQNERIVNIPILLPT